MGGCASTAITVEPARPCESPLKNPGNSAAPLARSPPRRRISNAGSACVLPHLQRSTLFQDPAPARLSAQKPVSLDDFEPLRKLGEGGFGVVLLVRRKPATDPNENGDGVSGGGGDNSGGGRNGKVYALKVMRADELVAAEMVTRVVAEKEILARLTHPFVVRLHYAFLSQRASQVFMVMEALLGGELYAMMQNFGFLPRTSAESWARRRARTYGRWGRTAGYGQQRGMPEAWARFYTAEIAAALFHLHRHGVLYRDLKPENVMLRVDGHVALTDFGLAMDREEEEGQGEIAGTLPYLAPDMLGDDPPTEAVDWWSLGFLLYEMLFGVPPFGTRVLAGDECANNSARREQLNRILFGELKFPPGRKHKKQKTGTLQDKAMGVSEPARDCVRRLLIRNENLRLGSGGGGRLEARRPSMLLRMTGHTGAPKELESRASPGRRAEPVGGNTMVAGRGFHEVEEHPFFAQLDFRLLIMRQVPPPFVPAELDTADSSAAAPPMDQTCAERYLGAGGEADVDVAPEGLEDLQRLRKEYKAYTAAPITQVVVESMGDRGPVHGAGARRASAQVIYTGSADTRRLRLTQVF